MSLLEKLTGLGLDREEEGAMMRDKVFNGDITDIWFTFKEYPMLIFIVIAIIIITAKVYVFKKN